ncbi:alpha/beta hydrolase [Vreelandella alkaliphila]|uniref:Alpha/beta hydrolase n=1 Tax=Vreelandella alkaliphila TaxID=272774 RepID=A0ABX4HHP0_9GAMM|nr:alpha/beta fold hydrolase [Halomonas humidisoli]PAU71979.1 alpha/beta hydrolase [Halomonas humidisoli]
MNLWLLAAGTLIASILVAILFHCFHQRLRQQLTPTRESVTAVENVFSSNRQTIRFATTHGLTLEGWWFTTTYEQKGHVLLTHGWGSNRTALLPLVPVLLAAGWNVLAFDVRNHGNSDEDTFSSMPRFAEDIDAALAWLHSNYDRRATALIGHSVGAAATLLAASRRSDITAVVSISSFAHPADMMKRWLAEKGIPFFPLGWYVLRYVERVIGYRFDTIAPLHTLAHISCPVLLVHGDSDCVIPQTDAYKLANQGGNAVLRLVRGGHDLTPSMTQHSDELVAFLQASVASKEAMCLAS